MAKLALLGIGRMGTELGKHLLAAGHQLTVWNRTPDGASSLVSAGASQAKSVAQAASGQDVVISCLFGPDTVREVITTSGSLPPGTLWLDITTVGPEDADEFANWATAKQVRYVHGPVVGSLGPARARKLGVYLGGMPDDVAETKPYVELWADPQRLVELPTARAAAVGKLVANLALGTALEGLVEALRFGKTQGVDASSVLRMLKSTALGFICDMKGPIIENGTFDDTQFSVDLLAKDAKLMKVAAGNTSLPAVDGLIESLTAAQQQGYGDYDIAAAALPDIW